MDHLKINHINAKKKNIAQSYVIRDLATIIYDCAPAKRAALKPALQILLGLFLIVVASPLWAARQNMDQLTSKWFYRFQGGAIQIENIYKTKANSDVIEAKFRPGPIVNVSIGYEINPKWSLELLYLTTKASAKHFVVFHGSESKPVSHDDVSFELELFGLNGLYHFNKDWFLSPYIGAAWMKADYKLKDKQGIRMGEKHLSDGEDASFKTQTVFELHRTSPYHLRWLVGLERKISEKSLIQIELRRAVLPLGSLEYRIYGLAAGLRVFF